MPPIEDIQQLHTARDFVRWGVSFFRREQLFFGHGTNNALDEALLLVLNALSMDHSIPDSYLDCRLTMKEREAVYHVITSRVEERIPAAYLTNEAWFAGLSFFVDQRVLIPRSPIAELIEAGFQPWLGESSAGRILDLCTGSGCIALACAYAFPDASVDAADISPAALEVAQINVERLDSSGRVRLVESDLFEGLSGERYDLIVSNPPYVDARDLNEMPVEFGHEPRLGLAAGDDGLEIIIKMLAQASDYLTSGGIMVAEVGNSAVALEERFPGVPFTWIEFERGGDGVFVLTREQLNEFRPLFSTAVGESHE